MNPIHILHPVSLRSSLILSPSTLRSSEFSSLQVLRSKLRMKSDYKWYEWFLPINFCNRSHHL
jgi:hypothetical protein